MSFVTTLTTDLGTIPNPSWGEVEAAIAQLDAERVTLVILAPSPPKGPPDGEHHMAVGGGKDQRCVVYITDDNLRFWNLEDRSKTGLGGRIIMRVGGQPGDYREAQCIPKAWALRAAREYFDRGARAVDLDWTES